MQTYPLCLVGLEQRRIIIVGGGQVAVRKARAILDAGGKIIAISPEFCPEFNMLAEESGKIEKLKRPYRNGDLTGAFLVISATDSPVVNRSVWEEALQERCLVNVVDDPDHSNFILPAVLERGDLKIAITTGGASPALSRRLRERLEGEIDPELGELAELMGELRSEIQMRFEPGEPRLHVALKLIDSDLIEIIRHDGRSAAHQMALAYLDRWQQMDE